MATTVRSSFAWHGTQQAPNPNPNPNPTNPNPSPNPNPNPNRRHLPHL